MALFLRGNVWWFEIRNTKIRIVKSTGFKKPDKKKAEAVYSACRLGVATKPKRSAMEAILDALYSNSTPEQTLPLSSVWLVYEDWMRGKAKIVSPKTISERKAVLARFIEFATPKKVIDITDVSVSIARQYVATALAGKANKTVRNVVQNLATIWEACSQVQPGIHNPWKAACPDNDGSGRRRDHFTEEERVRIFAACKEVGHEWYGTSLVACYTGLRYGDVAKLEWKSVDLEAGIIRVTPSKTKRHGTRVVLPIAAPLVAFLQSLPNKEGFVFPEHAVAYRTNNVQPPFAEVLKIAGVVGYHDFHSWRHTFRSMLAAAGVSDETARRMGGWTNLTMAAHYDHDPHLDEMREAVSKI